MWAIQSEGETQLTGWDKKPQKDEIMQVMCYGQDTSVFKQLIEDAINYSMEKDDKNTNIYEVHRWGLGWEKVHAKRPRSMESVILDSTIAEDVAQDISKF